MKKKSLLIISILISVVIILLVIILKKDQSNVPAGTGIIVQEGVIPGYTAEQIEEMMQRKADQSTFSFEINSRPVFEDGLSEGAIRIANPPYGAYSIQVTITLDSDQKKVFETGKLKPNQYIEKAKLLENLPAGEYPATATINAYDIETDEFVGTSAAKLIITIKQ